MDPIKEEIGGEIEEFPCTICGATFVTKMSLMIHNTLHDDEVKEEALHLPRHNLLLESLLKNGAGAEYVHSKGEGGMGSNRPVPNLKPIPSLIQLHGDQQNHDGKKFQCQLCGVCFWKKEDLSRHVTRTHGSAKFTCPYCQRNISRRDHLKRHIKNVHPEFCTETEVGPFSNSPAGRPKKRTHNGSPVFEESSSPKRCQVEFSRELSESPNRSPSYDDGNNNNGSVENEEFEENEENIRYKKESNEMVSEDDDGIDVEEENIGVKLEFPYQSQYQYNNQESEDDGHENIENNAQQDARREMQEKNGLPQFENHFDEEENDVSESESKISENGTTSDGKYKCELCEAAFISKINMERHMSTHSTQPSRTHVCGVCGKGFLRKEHLTKHLSSVHSGLKYRCQFCGKDISRKDHLLRHIRNCHPLEFQGLPPEMIDSEPQIAKVPAVTLGNNPNMRVAALSCDLCNDIFNHIDELLEHQSAVHSDIRKFKCDQCPKSFKRKEHLLKHQGTHLHSSLLPLSPPRQTFSCSECKKVFMSMEVAQAHLRQAHSKKLQAAAQNGTRANSLLPCNLCDNAFEQRSQLLYHLKAYHGVNNPERLGKIFGPDDEQLISPANILKNPKSKQPVRQLRFANNSNINPPVHSLLGIKAALSDPTDASLGSLMGLINKGSISLSLSRVTDRR